jgi:hypothetical protein
MKKTITIELTKEETSWLYDFTAKQVVKRNTITKKQKNDLLIKLSALYNQFNSWD